MTTPKHYDAIVIGTGQAGKPLASSLAGAGWKTAVIEKEERVGGSCIVTGCTPTKTMVASARVAYLASRARDYGVATGPISIDLARVRERKRAMVDKFSGAARRGLEREANADLIFGEARFASSHEVRVTSRDGEALLEAPRVFINTGTRPAIPDVPGLPEAGFLTNATIMELDRVPEHLVVIGGGYIGLEFGQMFRRFGARVTIVQRGAQLLPREDEDIASSMTEILRGEGIDVVLSARPTAVSRKGPRVDVVLDSPEGKRELDASEILVAAGRRPNSDGLGLDAAGIGADPDGFILVNERLETNVGGVWALGDVKGGPAFTHVSYDDYRIVEKNLLEGGNATTRERLVPYCVFTDPELGRVGLTEREAKDRGLDYRVAKIPMSRVARALESDETRGFMKAIVENGTERILGAAILGVQGGEIMSVLEVAMMGGLPYGRIRDGVFAHPTLAESLNNLFATLE
jgi:pyruvate/2-oxoglutarate dehydrogenase complex dihydrolipoamide dehydrogenase (E3) component